MKNPAHDPQLDLLLFSARARGDRAEATELESLRAGRKHIASNRIEAAQRAPAFEVEQIKAAADEDPAFRDWLPSWGTLEADRLEYLGDAIAGAVVTRHVAMCTPWDAPKLSDDHELAQARLSNTAMAACAASHELIDLFMMPKGGKATADALESLVGAWFVLKGLGAAVRLVDGLLCADLPPRSKPERWPGANADALRQSQTLAILHASQPRSARDRRRRPPSVARIENTTGVHLNDWTIAAMLDDASMARAQRKLSHVGNGIVRVTAALLLYSQTEAAPHEMTVRRMAVMNREWLGREAVWMSAMKKRKEEAAPQAEERAMRIRSLLGAIAVDRGIQSAVQSATVLFGLQAKRNNRRGRNRPDTYEDGMGLEEVNLGIDDFRRIEWTPPRDPPMVADEA